MRLNLTKPLVIFDLETTGLDLVKDKIIQISYIKVYPDGKEERVNQLINPERKLDPVIVQLTGFTDDDLKSQPTFKQYAPTLSKAIAGCDFAGYNSNHFDIPMLAEEFLRAGIDFDFSKSSLIDAMSIFRKMERRNLAAAYKFYCGRKMEEDFEAHRADQDTEATYRVIQGQLDRYAPGNYPDEPDKVLENNVKFLSDFSKMNNNVDFAGRIVWSDMKSADGQPILDENGNPRQIETFNFGKYKGMAVVEVLRRDPGYYSWMLNSDFTYNTKQTLTRIRLAEAKMNG